jgi:hypothetical protein
MYIAWMIFVGVYLKAPLAVCWTVEWIYAFFTGLFSYIYFKKGKWMNKEI